MESLMAALLLQILIIGSVEGEDYCSPSSGGECVQCSKLCQSAKVECNTTHYFCPRQCGGVIQAAECREVCSKNCRNGKCEYINGIIDLKCIGCEPEYTGKACQELCPEQCLECHQDKLDCISCKGNHTPPQCRDSLPTPVTGVTPEDIAPTVSTVNCSTECKSCNANSGECYECYIGSYGNICQYSCRHCMESLCDKNKSCFDCILNYKSLEKKCITDLTRVNDEDKCTDDNCNNAPGSGKYIMFIVVPVGITVLVIIVISVICARRRKARKPKREEDPIDDRQEPTPQIEFEVSSEDSGPYTFIRVVDRDCVPDHIFQAAMVTAPFLEPTSLPDHILQTLYVPVSENI